MDSDTRDERQLLCDIAKDVAWIKLELQGNGQPGLLTRVARLEGSNAQMAAKGGLVGAVAALLAALAAYLAGVGP